MKKARRRIDVNLEELDRVLDGAREAPLSESDHSKLETHCTPWRRCTNRREPAWVQLHRRVPGLGRDYRRRDRKLPCYRSRRSARCRRPRPSREEETHLQRPAGSSRERRVRRRSAASCAP